MTAAADPSRPAASQEAKALADAKTLAFVGALEDVITRAAEIAEGGDAYPAGVRDICATFGALGANRARAINSVLGDPDAGANDRRQTAPAPVPFADRRTFRLSADARLAPTPVIVERLARFSRREPLSADVA
jgi:hypothetical protein